MEWIRISSNKLKIMLTAKDAERYELKCEKAELADAPTRAAFREILTDIKKETDFDATEDKVYIQMYPSKEGGCELFVTKIGLLFGEEHDMSTSTQPKTAKRTKPPQKRSAAFSFADFKDLLSACRAIKERFVGDSEAWLDERRVWWLLLSEIGGEGGKEQFRFMRDYAKMHPFEQTRLFLPEHGRCICKKHAVTLLASLAN